MRTLFLILIALVYVFFSEFSFSATSGTIIQVARRMRMSYLEPLPPKDYFLDLGERDGVKAGDLVEAFRFMPVPNTLSGGAWHLMRVSLGELRVQHVGESTCVARFEKEREISSLPAMEYQSLMLGDQVQLKTGLPFK